MKLTIAATELERLMKGIFPRVPAKKALLKITAKDGTLTLECGDGGAGTAADVQSSGQVTLPAKVFRQVLETYHETPTLDLEGSSAGLRMNSFKMPITAWNPTP